MKTWSLLYALIWVAFVQILIGVVPVLQPLITYGVHPVVGLVVLVLSYLAFSQVKAAACPDRIKRITKTTFVLAAVQAFLGAGLYALVYLGASGTVVDVVDFVHVVNALAIVTQASSSATAFDMWEEKEFSAVPTAS